MMSATDHIGRPFTALHANTGPFGVDAVQPLPLSKILGFLLLVGIFTVSWHIARVGDVNFTVSDACFLGAIAGLIATSRLNLVPMAALTPAWLFSLVLMLGALFVSTIVNGDLVRWLVIAAQYTFAYLLLPILFASFDHKMLERCVVFYILGISTSQAIGNVANLFFDFADTAPYLGYNFITGLGRVAALSGNPNINGAMTGFAMVFLIYAVERRLLHPFLSVICGVFLIWGLIASASFGAFVICFSATVLVLVIRWPRRAMIALLVGGAVTVGYISSDLPLPGPFEERVLAALAGGGLEEAGTYAGRIELAGEAWRIASDTLFVGLGADGFRVASIYQTPVHVFPLLLLTEAGLFGLIGLIGLLGILWLKALSNLSIDRQRGATCIGIVLIFTLFTLTVPHMYARLWLAPVFLALSVCASAGNLQPMLSRQRLQAQQVNNAGR